MGNEDAAEALLDQGMTKAELSRQFKISRGTIHHRIETGQLDRDLGAGRTQYAPRSRPTHKLDRYKGIIEARLAEFPRLSAQRLFDQMRAVVLSDDRSGGGELVMNAEFLRFAAHWGFMARACRPYRARTKGKVERPIRYLRESFFYGRE